MKWHDIAFGIAAILAMVFTYRETNSELAAGLIGAFAAAWGIAFQFRLTRQNEAEARLFPQKAQAYEDLIILLSEMFQSQKKNGQTDTVATAERLVKIRTNLIIWGSARTIRALDSLGDPNPNATLEQMMERLARLYAAIRRDLGHDERWPDAWAIAKGHLIPEDRAKLK